MEPLEGDGGGAPPAKRAKHHDREEQTAKQEGRDPEDLFLPTTSTGRTFKDSLYDRTGDPPMYSEVKGGGKVENTGRNQPLRN